jgi:hypothetical protein
MDESRSASRGFFDVHEITGCETMLPEVLLMMMITLMGDYGLKNHNLTPRK